MICPKDGTACPDDLCHGSGCMAMDGYPMLSICPHCRGTVDEEIPDCGTCRFDDDDDYDCDHWLAENAGS
jgi:hypothetical protein